MTQPGLALLLTLALASLSWAQQQNERPLQPPMARAAFDEGLKLAQAGKLEAALTQFEEASRRGPTWSQSRYYEGACLTGLGRHADAAEAFSRAVALNESYMLAWAARADAHFHLGNYAQSAFDYGRVIELQRRVTDNGEADKTFIRQLLGNLGRIGPGTLLNDQ